MSKDAVGFSVCACFSNSLGIDSSVCFKERLNLLRFHTGYRIITLFQVSLIRLVVLPKILIFLFARAFSVFIYISILFLPPLIAICPFLRNPLILKFPFTCHFNLSSLFNTFLFLTLYLPAFSKRINSEFIFFLIITEIIFRDVLLLELHSVILFIVCCHFSTTFCEF